MMKTYFKYWGKAERVEEGGLPRYHLLPYHCLDVAAVGWLLFDPDKSLCLRLARQLVISSQWLQSFFVFCLALHDIGKFSRAFQGLQPGLSSDLVKPNRRMRYDSRTARHDTLGFFLWRDCLASRFGERLHLDRSCTQKIKPWLEIVTGHHGMPPKTSGIRTQNFFQEEDEDAAWHFVVDLYNQLFSTLDFSLLQNKDFKQRLKTVSWQLAGIAVLADWLGSNREHFEYCNIPRDLSDYWKVQAIPSARKAMRAMPNNVNVNRFTGIKKVFPFILQPTPLQQYAVETPLPDGPQLFILEDVTGAGKTEAALVLTHRLLSAGQADGFYVALPTMATANAMYQRLSEVYRVFYIEHEQPSLILAHGARSLSDSFRNSVFLPENEKEGLNYEENNNRNEPELCASAYCNAWLADNRKKALLADVGVGTLDQALLAVLPARHQSLRLLGLGRKVLLIDEVHAYDCYMQQLLDALLEAHARQGGSAILLSATLPQTMRKKLVAAFHRGLGREVPPIANTSYPLATHFPANADNERHIDTREEVKRTVTVSRLDTDDEVVNLIRQATEKGQCVCWIRNTVKAARESHRMLAQCEWMDDKLLHLFHSRFAMVDRQKIEEDTVRRFGKDSTAVDRRGQILIATQVVEQSLDLDFDVLITDLAPIDLIIQRAGRLCRHIRDSKGKRIEHAKAKDQRGKPILYLFAPDPLAAVDEGWLKKQQKGTQAVYQNLGQLWLTAKILLDDKEGKFSMPEDARGLIEGVYSDEAEAGIPENILATSMQAVGENLMQQNMADLNALKLNKGYTWSSGDWDEEIRTPTRLSEVESVSVALAFLSNGQLLPYAKEAQQYEWPLSIVKIPDWEWKEAKKAIPATLQKQIDELKTEIKALRWVEVFPLTEETMRFYSADGGWQIEKGESI
ncbi:MAG: CRISPR-associated helicase Cas3' [Desulfobulbaceae bacterium]|nr:CRISPR-associated helicase Cas3' [Desulfobulbaceae bacterium]